MQCTQLARQFLRATAARKVACCMVQPCYVPHGFLKSSTTSTRSNVALFKSHIQQSSSECMSQKGKRTITSRSLAGSGSGSGGGGKGPSGGSGGSGSAEPQQPSGGHGLWAAYLKLTETHPIAVKCCTCAVLNAFGDVFSQLVFEGDKPFSWLRLAKFSALGFVLVAPALHFWYLTLARLVPHPGTAGALGRLAADQLLFAPFFTSTFISALMTLDGQAENIVPKLRQDIWSIVQVNWLIWVPAQFINFRFVPQNLQVFAANITALVWNTYLSWASHKAVDAQPA